MTLSNLSKTSLLGLLLLSGASAQIQNPIQAAKDAYNRAKQQTAQQQEVAQSRGSAQTPANASAQATDSSNCCSPEVMKQYADAASVLDIVGIKLGMTPEQAIAAVKAYNPNLRIDIIKAPIQHPGANPSVTISTEHVPLFIYAHTASTIPQQGQVEDITVRLTTPPTTPVVAEVARYIAFHTGEPVVASTLTESFHKKYGIENFELGSDAHVWIYDRNGKLLPRVTGPDTFCIPAPGLPRNFEPGREAEGLNLLNTADNIGNEEYKSGCMPYLYVMSPGLGNGIAPNRPLVEITTTIKSGALVAGSIHATHAWLQAESDARRKQQQDGAAKRSAPPM